MPRRRGTGRAVRVTGPQLLVGSRSVRPRRSVTPRLGAIRRRCRPPTVKTTRRAWRRTVEAAQTRAQPVAGGLQLEKLPTRPALTPPGALRRTATWSTTWASRWTTPDVRGHPHTWPCGDRRGPARRSGETAGTKHPLCATASPPSSRGTRPTSVPGAPHPCACADARRCGPADKILSKLGEGVCHDRLPSPSPPPSRPSPLTRLLHRQALLVGCLSVGTGGRRSMWR